MLAGPAQEEFTMARKPQRQAPAQLNVRVALDLRQRLERAAAERGVSLNREITDRLTRSLTEDDADVQRESDVQTTFYGTTLRGIMALVASAMHWAGRRGSWLDDPLAYYRAIEAADVVLKALAPPAKIEASEQIKQRAKLFSEDAAELEKGRAKTLARMTAQELIEDIASARPGHMVGAQQRVDQLRADLGPLVERLSEYAKAHPVGAAHLFSDADTESQREKSK
jgi:hypothetical protein